ncbi:MAG: import component protein [Mucilaginibacter sp.]|nr:import component protein [Mucilaginibacter sp.]
MTKKTMAMVAYITIIGWIVAYLSYKKDTEKSSLVNYHLGQALGILIAYIVLSAISFILLSFLPFLATILYVVLLIPFVLLLFGIVAASNEVERPVPIIGKIFEGWFNFSPK